tara:strand:- start:542 stop:1738 length:1197 start_codon:yes stop_codon:yes gene_type:complete
MNLLTFQCPVCDGVFRADDSATEVACPHCHEIIELIGDETGSQQSQTTTASQVEMTVTRNATLSPLLPPGFRKKTKSREPAQKANDPEEIPLAPPVLPAVEPGIDELEIVNELPASSAVEDMNAPVPPSEPVSQSLVVEDSSVAEAPFSGISESQPDAMDTLPEIYDHNEAVDPNLNENVTTVSELDTLVEFGADILDDESEASLTDESAGFENAVFPVDVESLVETLAEPSELSVVSSAQTDTSEEDVIGEESAEKSDLESPEPPDERDKQNGGSPAGVEPDLELPEDLLGDLDDPSDSDLLPPSIDGMSVLPQKPVGLPTPVIDTGEILSQSQVEEPSVTIRVEENIQTVGYGNNKIELLSRTSDEKEQFKKNKNIMVWVIGALMIVLTMIIMLNL